MKQISFIGIVVLLVTVIPGWGSDIKEFPIGALFPMTGPQSFYGRVMSRGAQLAVDELNSAGGVEGFRFKLIISDFKNVDTDLAAAGIKRMVEQDRVSFVLVSFSAVILKVQPFCEKEKVLMINPGAYSPHLMNKPYLYSTKLVQTQMIPPMLEFFWDMNIRKLAMLYISNPAGVIPANEIVKPMWTSKGGIIVAEESHPPGIRDFHPYLSRIRQAKPDAIYDISTGEDQAYVIKNAREMSITIPITVPDWAPDYYAITGKLSRDVYIPGDYFQYESSNPHTKHFVKNYESKWRELPEIFAANYYDTVYYLLPELIRRVVASNDSPLSGEKLEKAIWQNPNFQSIYGGTIKLNLNGTCSGKPMGIFNIVDGKKVLIKQMNIE